MNGTTSKWVPWAPAFALVLACSSVSPARASGEDRPNESTIAIPPEMTTSYLMYERARGRVLVQRNPDKAYRSASVVKILIALDYLYAKGSMSNVPPNDLAALQSMLRSSDDDAAGDFWDRAGQTAVIDRMVAKLGLTDTQRPTDPNFWGYTAVTASDVLRIYRYLLDDGRDEFRRFVLDNLGQSTQCATDGRDQYFGIPRAVPAPFRIKQGWSAFGDVPPGEECKPAAPRVDVPPSVSSPPSKNAPRPDLDLKSHLLHTTGLVDHDGKILIVLSLYPKTVPWEQAATKLTFVTRQVYVEGEARAAMP